MVPLIGGGGVFCGCKLQFTSPFVAAAAGNNSSTSSSILDLINAFTSQLGGLAVDFHFVAEE